MCEKDDCETLTRWGHPIQFDYGHLTYEGSLMLIRNLKAKGYFKSLNPQKGGSE